MSRIENRPARVEGEAEEAVEVEGAARSTVLLVEVGRLLLTRLRLTEGMGPAVPSNSLQLNTTPAILEAMEYRLAAMGSEVRVLTMLAERMVATEGTVGQVLLTRLLTYSVSLVWKKRTSRERLC
jgi:hypothetical protein